MHNVCTVSDLPELTRALRRLPALLPSARWVCWVHDFALGDEPDDGASGSWFPNAPAGASGTHAGARGAGACEGWEYVAVSEARAREVEEGLGVECAVVPNGVDPAVVLQLSPKVASFAEKSGCWDADAVLLAPARLVARKNLELGIRVVHAARERGFRMQLLLTGGEDFTCPADVAYAKYLRVLSGSLKLEDAVFFLGTEIPMGARAFFEYSRVADALFFSGQREGFGLPVLEGGVLGKPVFCLENEALSGLPGALVFAGDLSVPELAEWIISRILGSDTIMARRKILRDYRWPSIYHNHIEPLLTRSPLPYHP